MILFSTSTAVYAIGERVGTIGSNVGSGTLGSNIGSIISNITSTIGSGSGAQVISEIVSEIRETGGNTSGDIDIPDSSLSYDNLLESLLARIDAAQLRIVSAITTIDASQYLVDSTKDVLTDALKASSDVLEIYATLAEETESLSELREVNDQAKAYLQDEDNKAVIKTNIETGIITIANNAVVSLENFQEEVDQFLKDLYKECKSGRSDIVKLEASIAQFKKDLAEFALNLQIMAKDQMIDTDSIKTDLLALQTQAQEIIALMQTIEEVCTLEAEAEGN